MTDHFFIIDNVAFSKRAERLSGVIPINACHRLIDYVNSNSMLEGPADFDHLNQVREIKFSISGEEDAMGKCFLHLQIQVELRLICQRCLSEMPMDLSLTLDYLVSDLILGDEEEVSQFDDSDDYDLLEPNQAMDVLSLIEDELILAIPMSPRHDFNCAAAAMQAGEKANPFAVLKNLIKPADNT